MPIDTAHPDHKSVGGKMVDLNVFRGRQSIEDQSTTTVYERGGVAGRLVVHELRCQSPKAPRGASCSLMIWCIVDLLDRVDGGGDITGSPELTYSQRR